MISGPNVPIFLQQETMFILKEGRFAVGLLASLQKERDY
jgi:hypothetical protein